MKLTKLKQFSMIGRLESCGLSWVNHVPAYCKYGVWSKRHTDQRSEYVQEYGREIIRENERIVNFTCNLRFVPEWEWMLQDQMTNAEVAHKVGLADDVIHELVEGNTWYPPLVSTNGQIVHP